MEGDGGAQRKEEEEEDVGVFPGRLAKWENREDQCQCTHTHTRISHTLYKHRETYCTNMHRITLTWKHMLTRDALA